MLPINHYGERCDVSEYVERQGTFILVEGTRNVGEICARIACIMDQQYVKLSDPDYIDDTYPDWVDCAGEC